MYEMTRPMVNFPGKYSMCPQSSHNSTSFVVRRSSYDSAAGKNTADRGLQVMQLGQRVAQSGECWEPAVADRGGLGEFARGWIGPM